MDTLHTRIPPKAAVEAAFREFKELFAGARTSHVLLEGLEYDEHEDVWRVTIGFDVGRNRETGSENPLAPWGPTNRSKEPIREFRQFLLNANSGDFIKMGSP